MPFQTWFTTTLAERAEVADTSIVVAVAPTITSWRALLRNSSWTLREWISFTWVTWTTLTWVTRWLSQTADPATSGTWLTWIAGTKISIVAMHDQIMDRQKPKPLVFATTAARDSALWANGAATEAYVNVYVTATWLHYHYNLSTAQWEELDVWTVTPNASATAAGKVEIATSAESIAGTDTWGTGAFISVLPSDIAKNAQNQAQTYVADTGAADAYVITLAVAPAAYAAGQRFAFKATNANTTTSTLNVNSLGVKTIKKHGWLGNLLASDIVAGQIVEVEYDGTNFQMVSPTSAGSGDNYFGDGSDGDVTISSGTTTLSTDMFYNNLTLSWTGILNPNWYKVFVKGKLTIGASAKIQRNWTTGTAGTDVASVGAGGGAGGAALNAWSMGAEQAWANGGNVETNGSNGTSNNPTYQSVNWVAGGNGGRSDSSSSVKTWGTGGTSTRGTLYKTIASTSKLLSYFSAVASVAAASDFTITQLFPSAAYKVWSGGGGGAGGLFGGGGASGTAGGGGGAGGNWGKIFVAATEFDSAGTVEAIGGAGGAGGYGQLSGGNYSGGGGGGAWWSGGNFTLVTRKLTNIGTVTLTGWAGGAGWVGGSNPTGNGANGTTGNAGTYEVIYV